MEEKLTKALQECRKKYDIALQHKDSYIQKKINEMEMCFKVFFEAKNYVVKYDKEALENGFKTLIAESEKEVWCLNNLELSDSVFSIFSKQGYGIRFTLHTCIKEISAPIIKDKRWLGDKYTELAEYFPENKLSEKIEECNKAYEEYIKFYDENELKYYIYGSEKHFDTFEELLEYAIE